MYIFLVKENLDRLVDKYIEDNKIDRKDTTYLYGVDFDYCDLVVANDEKQYVTRIKNTICIQKNY